MPVLDLHSQGLLHDWPFELHIQAETLDAQSTGELASADRTPRSAQCAGQVHFVQFARDCPRAGEIFLAGRFARSNLRSTV